MLPIAQFAYNSLKNTITGIILFFTNRGREPTIEQLPIEIQRQSYNKRLLAKRIKDLHKNSTDRHRVYKLTSKALLRRTALGGTPIQKGEESISITKKHENKTAM
jgi:hypothetical protein